MSYPSSWNDDVYYIVEVEVGGEILYMFTRNVALHFADMGKKFLYKRSAQRYYKGSEFEKRKCNYRIVRYSRYQDRIID